MAKTYQQILDEMGKVPPEQSIRDEEELIAEIGEAEFAKEEMKAALANSRLKYQMD